MLYCEGNASSLSIICGLGAATWIGCCMTHGRVSSKAFLRGYCMASAKVSNRALKRTLLEALADAMWYPLENALLDNLPWAMQYPIQVATPSPQIMLSLPASPLRLSNHTRRLLHADYQQTKSDRSRTKVGPKSDQSLTKVSGSHRLHYYIAV